MVVFLLIGAALLVSLVLVLWSSAGSGRLARSRLTRLLRIGRMSARLSTSWLGARWRRRFSSPERRSVLDAAARRKSAAQVAETMGHMKGAFMKLGQMLSFVSDDIPEEYRSAL